MPDAVAIFLVVIFAAFTQTSVGFGFALVSMPLMVTLLGPIPAASLGAILALTTQIAMLNRYRGEIAPHKLWRLMVGTLLGVPIGVRLLSRMDEGLVLAFLGILLVVYALYSLLAPRLPYIRNPNWGFGIGLVSGTLGGAYNTSGPPFVIYGMSRQWPPPEFKGNMQVLLMTNTIAATVAHAVASHYSPEIGRFYLLSLPAIALGTVLGFWVDNRINAILFRRIVLVMLLIIGVRLILA